MYYTQVLCVDEEEFGGHAGIVQEGFLQSFALFLVSNWDGEQRCGGVLWPMACILGVVALA